MTGHIYPRWFSIAWSKYIFHSPTWPTWSGPLLPRQSHCLLLSEYSPPTVTFSLFHECSHFLPGQGPCRTCPSFLSFISLSERPLSLVHSKVTVASLLYFPFMSYYTYLVDLLIYLFIQFSSVAQSCPTLCDPQGLQPARLLQLLKWEERYNRKKSSYLRLTILMFQQWYPITWSLGSDGERISYSHRNPVRLEKAALSL